MLNREWAAGAARENKMLNADQRYRAYQLLKELDKSTAALMNRVAYSHGGKICWEEDLEAQRKAFREWIDFAVTIRDDV
ncbi:hypothetical protein H0H12_12800 [Pseudomonas putida]|uniref:Uncharacterized protein n=1 Tax=Pseudomonas putida TaxID=303 RepID=A0A7D5W2P7_PSEPU|nr:MULTISPECIES: hypothetical protein [Pseudomonas]MCE0965626.1 hypothetical protein [Pseudomonas sp. NMI4491_12]QLJ16747.1 hypothetical protein H0H12_12800 [Pseudomonas putida]